MAQLEEGIAQSYRDIFGRDPNQDEINFYAKEFGGDDMYDAIEEQSLEQRLYDSASAARRSIADQANILADSGERAAKLEQQKITDAEEAIKEDIGIDQLVPRNQIIDLYRTELGRDPNEQEIQYYQSYYTKRGTSGIDPFELRQFQSTPEAVKYRSGFKRAFPTLYEDVFRVQPTEQQTAEARERFGDFISPEEVNRFIRDPQTIAQVQSGIRSTLGIPAVTQSGTGPIDFSKFNRSPVTTGPTATAGIERLRPTDAAGNLISGTIADVFANPRTATELESESGEGEAEGMRTGGIASLGYRRGGGVMEDGVMRYGLGGEIRKLYKGVKRIVKPIYRAVKPYIPYVLPPQIGIPLAAADAGFTDGKFDAKKAAFAAAKVYAANKVQDAMAGTDSFAQFKQPVALDPSKAGPTQPFPQIARDPSVFESVKQFGSKVGESFDPRNISLQGMRSGAEFGIGRAADALSLKGGPGSITKAAPGAVGLTTIKGAEIAEEQMKEQKARRDAILGAQERERKKYRDLAARLGQQFPYQYKEGGISSLPPRYLDGAGDGMSDSIKANIGGMQEARLADGEFVVPADVVADLGNGSSNAGAERLYSMMDRIRQARHGTTKQPPEVNVNKTLPA